MRVLKKAPFNLARDGIKQYCRSEARIITIGAIDPEDLREVISAYQKCVADTVQRFGGFVAKYMGDGVWCISDTRRRMRMTLNVRRGSRVAWATAVDTQRTVLRMSCR